MEKLIKWGIIGPGKIARKFAVGLRAVKNAKLYGVASRNTESAEIFAKEFDVPFYYGSYEELVKNSEVDVIYIATPHSQHFNQTILCLQHHKAVLCEKPFAINLKQAKEMVGLARKNEVFLMEAMWTRFLPSIKKVKELIADGVIGKVKTIQADFGFKSDFDPDWRLYNRAMGGGSLLDIGVYPLFLATTILGRPTHVKALSNLCSTQVDENCGMVLTYEDGAMAVLLSSIVSYTLMEASISGTNGRIKINHRWHSLTDVTVYYTEAKYETFSFDYEGNGYNYEAEEVNKCLLEGKKESSAMTLDDTLLLMEVMDQVRNEAGIIYSEDGEAASQSSGI